jgi:hypothetical protein
MQMSLEKNDDTGVHLFESITLPNKNIIKVYIFVIIYII